MILMSLDLNMSSEKTAVYRAITQNKSRSFKFMAYMTPERNNFTMYKINFAHTSR